MVYTVAYRMTQWGEQKELQVVARSKYEAYDKAMYEIIPEIHTYSPYSAWVQSVTYQNGNYRVFNTSEGNAY